MVTTNAAKDDIVEALKAGVNNYVVKPFTAETYQGKDRRRVASRAAGLKPTLEGLHDGRHCFRSSSRSSRPPTTSSRPWCSASSSRKRSDRRTTPLRPKSQIVVGTVGFAGSSTGLVAFHGTLDAARDIASAMLGHAGRTSDRGGMADAIGEITNMIAGVVPHAHGGAPATPGRSPCRPSPSDRTSTSSR